MGLRELKKKRTRKAISDMATLLFIERGYNEVTTAEIAELCEVSVPTLFKYFPTKEALVFDEDTEREEGLIHTVTNRKKGQTIIDALLEAGLKEFDEFNSAHKNRITDFMNLIENTPELSLYAKQMWMRHEKSLAAVIRKETKNKVSKLEAESVAHFVLDSYHRSLASSNPKTSLKILFKILKDGWSE